MCLMRTDPLRGQVGGGWALWNGIKLLGECHLGPKKSRYPGPAAPSHLPKQWICPHQKHYIQGRINQRSKGCFCIQHSVFYSVFCSVCCDVYVHELLGCLRTPGVIVLHDLYCVGVWKTRVQLLDFRPHQEVFRPRGLGISPGQLQWMKTPKYKYV